MPLNREEIKHAPVSPEAWRQPRTSILWFDPRQIRPLGNHILVELDVEHPYIELDGRAVGLALEKPQIAEKDIGTRLGTVLAVGPGKWYEKPGLSWELTRQYFKPTTLRPGDRVYIGHYSDWESWNCSADGHESRGANIVLCQEEDVRLVEVKGK